MMKNKKKYGKPKFVLLNVLCFVLVMVLGTSLMASLSLRYTVQEELLPVTAKQLPLSEIPVNDSTAAQFILDEFIQDERVSVENVQKVMEDGTFSTFLAELTERYNTYLREGGEFPQVQSEEFVKLIEENADLIYAETGLRFLDADKQKLRENLSEPISEWNAAAEQSMHKGVSGFAVKASVSLWLPIVLGILLLAVMVWMIVIYVRSGFRTGTAFKMYAIALFVPSILVVLATIAANILVAVKSPTLGKTVALLNNCVWAFAIGVLAAAVIFGLGILCNFIVKGKKAPAAQAEEVYDGFFAGNPKPQEESTEPEPKAEPEAEEQAQRKFCRNCGQPLVNPDAKFCYKCGNVQEHVNTEE